MDPHTHGPGEHATSDRKDPPGGHGMLVIGTDAIFFSHLPMFMSPHDYQVVFEGTFSQQGSDAQRIYREDRKAHPQVHVYTFNPAAFVLPDLFPPAPKRKEIRGDLFRGHFESPREFPEEPVEIATGVEVNVTNVVFSQRLIPHLKSPDSLEYLLFGKGEELFLAHLITKPGDFDQIVSARVTGHQFQDDELRRGVRVQFTGIPNSATQRLTKGKTVSGSALIFDKKVPITVEPRLEFYLMERELA
jgi:hypothetical protein